MKTLSTNVLAGKDTTGELIYLVKIEGDSTTYRWSTSADVTDGVESYDGDVLDLTNPFGVIRHTTDVASGGSAALSRTVIIQARNDASLHESLTDDLENRPVSISAYFRGVAISDFATDAVRLWTGVVDSVEWDKNLLCITCIPADEVSQASLPSSRINESDYPFVEGKYLSTPIPILYGSDVLCKCIPCNYKYYLWLFANQGDDTSIVHSYIWDDNAHALAEIKTYPDESRLVAATTGTDVLADQGYVRLPTDQNAIKFIEFVTYYPGTEYPSPIAGEADAEYDVGLDDVWGNSATDPEDAAKEDGYADMVLPSSAGVEYAKTGTAAMWYYEACTLRFKCAPMIDTSVDEFDDPKESVLDIELYFAVDTYLVGTDDDELAFKIMETKLSAADDLLTGEYAHGTASTNWTMTDTSPDYNASSFAKNPAQYAVSTWWGIPVLGNVQPNATCHVTEMYVEAKLQRYKLRAYDLFVERDGRNYGSWIDASGRDDGHDEDDLIECPASIIESLLRDELGFATAAIDTDSFDAVANTINGTRKDWTFGRQITDETTSIKIIDQICYESGLAYVPASDGMVRLISLDTDASPSRTIYQGVIPSTKTASVTKTPLDDVCNDFTLRYDYSPASGTYNECVTDYDVASQTKYNLTRTWEYQAQWIHDSTTAASFLAWMKAWLAYRHKIVTLPIKYFHAVDLELGDQVDLQLDIVTGTYMVTGITVDPTTDDMELTLFEMR